jgi:hypothetical protein
MIDAPVPELAKLRKAFRSQVRAIEKQRPALEEAVCSSILATMYRKWLSKKLRMCPGISALTLETILC